MELNRKMLCYLLKRQIFEKKAKMIDSKVVMANYDHEKRNLLNKQIEFHHAYTLKVQEIVTLKKYYQDIVKFQTAQSKEPILRTRHDKDKIPHTSEKPYKCTECKLAFSQESLLNTHIQRHMEKQNYTCTQCNFAFAKKARFQSHMRKHTSENPFKCTLCDYASSHKQNLTIHMRTHTGEKPYKCSHCNYSCTSNSNLRKHERKHMNALNRPIIAHTGENPLNIDMQKQSKIQKYTCEQCCIEFARKANFKSHMRKHTGEKPFKCTYCDFASSHKQNLTIHMRIHTGEKPYKCSRCDYSCTNSSNLKKHERVHTRSEKRA